MTEHEWESVEEAEAMICKNCGADYEWTGVGYSIETCEDYRKALGKKLKEYYNVANLSYCDLIDERTDNDSDH